MPADRSRTSNVSGWLYLASAFDAIYANICPIHGTTEPDCDGCQGTLSETERREALELAKVLFRRWIKAGRPDRIDVESTVTSVDRYGLAIAAQAVSIKRVMVGR